MDTLNTSTKAPHARRYRKALLALLSASALALTACGDDNRPVTGGVGGAGGIVNMGGMGGMGGTSDNPDGGGMDAAGGSGGNVEPPPSFEDLAEKLFRDFDSGKLTEEALVSQLAAAGA